MLQPTCRAKPPKIPRNFCDWQATVLFDSLLRIHMDQPEDLDRLVGELGRVPAPAEADTLVLERWLRVLVSRGAADLFLVAGFPPAIRIDGAVVPLPEAPLDG